MTAAGAGRVPTRPAHEIGLHEAVVVALMRARNYGRAPGWLSVSEVRRDRKAIQGKDESKDGFGGHAATANALVQLMDSGLVEMKWAKAHSDAIQETRMFRLVMKESV